jgi:hypothetical protein
MINKWYPKASQPVPEESVASVVRSNVLSNGTVIPSSVPVANTNHNYAANIARWKAGVASGSINAATRNFRAARKAQNNARLQQAKNALASRNQLNLQRVLTGQGSGVYVPPSNHNIEAYWNQFMSPENRERIRRKRTNNAAAKAKGLAALRGQHGPSHAKRKSRKNRR